MECSSAVFLALHRVKYSSPLPLVKKNRSMASLVSSEFLCYTLCRQEMAVYAGKMGYEHETLGGRKP